MNKKFLITGVSGSGKSTLEKIFDTKGYQTSDIDYGFAQWRDKSTGAVEPNHPQDAKRLSEVYWALKTEELKKRLNAASEDPVLIFGSTNDLSNHADLFDRIFLLEYPNTDAIISRLASRPDTGYGKTLHERDSVLAYFREYQETMKQLGAIAIDCTLPLDQIADLIESGVQSE